MIIRNHVNTALIALILPIFAIAFSSLGQASQVTEKCLVSRFAVPHIHIWKGKKKKKEKKDFRRAETKDPFQKLTRELEKKKKNSKVVRAKSFALTT